jgi:large subunit ribosomal protein L10
MSLAKRAAENIGLDTLNEYFAGPTGVTVIESDPVEAAKVIKEFSKENEAFVIKGGLMDSEPLTLDQINILAEIEPRDVLLAKIAGGFNAPLVKVAASAKAVINKAGYALSALVDKKASGEEVSEATNSNEEEVASDEVKNEEE